MTTTSVTYDEYMAALGWPEHHILVGPDWWGCICNISDGTRSAAAIHADINEAGTDTTSWTWRQARHPTESMAGWHRRLWEAEAFE